MRSAKAKAWIFGNHSPLNPDLSRISPHDLIVAVDKGLETVHRLQLKPGLILGDFDSLSEPGLLEVYSDTPLIRLQPDKNATDTEHAFEELSSLGYRKITLFNDLGGRFDHALALIRNLEAAHREGIDCRIETGSQILFMLDAETELDYPPGTLLSLLALSPELKFVSSSGLQYPLDDLLILNYQTRGISNLITQSPARILREKGSALAVITIL